MISFENVSKFILKDVNIHIPNGCSVGVIGPSGAGKTTFLRLACGFLECEKGAVYISGKRQKPYSKGMEKNIGVLFTDIPIMDENESVYDNFKMRKEIYRLSQKNFEDSYARLSHKLEFDSFRHERVKNLSLGQRRRVEIGAILLHVPQLILMDEVTNGLDANAKNAFRELVQEEVKRGATVIMSSHDFASISEVCERIAVINQGRFIYYGSEELLLKKYVPMDKMKLTLKSAYPNPDDMPLERYTIEDNKLILTYNSNHITAAEIMREIVPKVSIEEVNIEKSDLTDAIIKMMESEENE